MNKYCGGDKEIYPFMSANEYVEKVLPVIEGF